MQITDFSTPMRQSQKGIIVIFGVQLYKVIKNTFIPLIVVGISSFRRNSFNLKLLTYITIGIILLLLTLLAITILKYLNFKFHVSEQNFYLNSGIINKENTIIPKTKIQNVSIRQNVIQQIINVVSVNIETAGDDKSEIEINALDKSTALALKEELLVSEIKRDEIIDDFTITEPNVYFKATVKRLFLEGITQNHLRSFGIMAAFLIGIYTQIRDVVKELNIAEDYSDYMAYEETTILTILFTNIIIVIVVVFISVLFSMIRTFITNYDLKVLEKRNTIEINKGLLQKISLALVPSRIQNIIISTNRLKRYFGLNSLYIKQAMMTKKQQNQLSIVALGREQIQYLTKKLIANLSFDIHRFKPSYYYIRIMALRASIILILINIVCILFFKTSGLLCNVIVVPFIVLFIRTTYRKSYYYLDNNHLFLGSGFIDTITDILENHKIQVVKVKQSFFQKRHEVASLIISTASKSITIPYIKEDEAFNIHDFLVYKVESENRNWM